MKKVRSIAQQAIAARTVPPVATSAVTFDPQDGRKRVVITVEADGTFAPVEFYGMAYGVYEASNIAAHGALILTEGIWRGAAQVATNGD